MAPTYDDMVTWIALNDKGATGAYRSPHEYYSLETVKLLAAVFERSVFEVAIDVAALQKRLLKAIDEG